MGFSGQEYWSGKLFPSPGDLPEPGIESRSPASQADSLPSEPLFETCTTALSFLKLRAGSISIFPVFWPEPAYIMAMYVSPLLLTMPFFIAS